MTTTYRARAADVASDEGTLLRLWTANLQRRGDVRDHFDWYYKRTPSGPNGAFMLEACTEGGVTKTVGCAGIGERRFFRRGEPLRAALLGDLAVDPDHRTLFPALVLERAVRDHCRQAFALAYGFPSEAAAPLFKRLGFVTLGHMKRYARVLRVDPYLERRVSWPPLARALAAAPNATLGALDVARAMRGTSGVRLEWLSGVDARFDRLWDAAHASHPIVGYRGADFLHWRYFERPGPAVSVAALSRDRELLAYAVVQPDGPVAHLRDLFGRGEVALAQLLRSLFPALRSRGHASVSVSIVAPPRYLAVLEVAGFSAREAARPVIVDAVNMSGDEEWYLLDGDEDV